MTTDLKTRLDLWRSCHQHPTNRLLHWIAVPLALWGATALLWLLPVPTSLAKPGLWAAALMFVAYLTYLRHSRHIAWTLAAAFIVLALVTAGVYRIAGATALAGLGVAALVVAHVGLIAGHRREGHAPRLAQLPGWIWLAPAALAACVLTRFRVDY